MLTFFLVVPYEYIPKPCKKRGEGERQEKNRGGGGGSSLPGFLQKATQR